MTHRATPPQRHNRNDPRHLGSIALNNMAVSLLERADYIEALETMKDSIHLMKVFCRPRDSDSTNADINVNALLRQATNRCLHTNIHTASTTGSHDSTISCRNIHNDLHDWCAMELPKSTRPTRSKTTCQHVYPIRIDECLCGFGEPDFESAILLHNFALAYYCLGHVPVFGSDLHHPTHRYMAVQLWDNAQNVLSRFYKCSCHTYLQPTACLVSIAILHSLIPLQHSMVPPSMCEAFPSESHGTMPPPWPDVGTLTKTMKWCCSVVVTHYQRVRCTATFASAA